MKILLAIVLACFATAALAQTPRARYYYHGEPHIGPATAGTMYDSAGRNVGRSYTDSQGSTTIYGNDGRVIGRTATDSQGSTTFYDAAGRKTGTAVPERR